MVTINHLNDNHHNYHNETSLDSISNLSADLLASTPVEKCSLNTRRGRNKDAPKRQLLTGYIIYASEIRKQVIEKNPNQNFGDISRMVGNDWKTLPYDIKHKYDQRALIHNKKVRERTQRDGVSVEKRVSTNSLRTPKLSKRKLAKLAKDQVRQHHLSSFTSNLDNSTATTPKLINDRISSNETPISELKNHQPMQQTKTTTPQVDVAKVTTVETCTQTNTTRFVDPPTNKRLVHSESFKKYLETMKVSNRDLPVEETTPDRQPTELPDQWLGAGLGRHESPEAALWALRDFMLQDAITMKRSMSPYI